MAHLKELKYEKEKEINKNYIKNIDKKFIDYLTEVDLARKGGDKTPIMTPENPLGTTVNKKNYNKTPFTTFNTNDTYGQESIYPTEEEMLVKLFEEHPKLIEALSIIAEAENISTMDMIIYMLDDYLLPIEYK